MTEQQPQTQRVARVKRVLIAQYDVPVEHYDGLTDVEIVALEQDVDDPGVVLDNAVDEIVDVRFVELPR